MYLNTGINLAPQATDAPGLVKVVDNGHPWARHLKYIIPVRVKAATIFVSWWQVSEDGC
ncbi:unnamed protein product, partial [marine sediment metagenome]